MMADWALMDQTFYVNAVIYTVVCSGIYAQLLTGAKRDDLDRCQKNLSLPWPLLLGVLDDSGYVQEVDGIWYWVGESPEPRLIHQLDVMRRWLNLGPFSASRQLSPFIQTSEDNRLRDSSSLLNERVVSLMHSHKPKNWLDVGGGTGSLSRSLASQGIRVTMADKPQTVERTAINLQHPNIRLWAGDILDSLPRGLYDVISLIRLIEDFPLATTVDLLKRLKSRTHSQSRLVLIVTTVKAGLWSQLFAIEVHITTSQGQLYPLYLLHKIATASGWWIKTIQREKMFNILILEPASAQKTPHITRRPKSHLQMSPNTDRERLLNFGILR